MPVVITFSFGSPGQMPPMSDEKTPDPERAKELLGALSRPSHELVERLDHALRMEEEVRPSVSASTLTRWRLTVTSIRCFLSQDAGVEDMERTGAQCSVCMDTLVDSPGQSEEVVTLPCSHCFHAECLRPWLETNTNCPTCRFDLDPFSTTLRPHRQTPGRAPAAPTPNSAEAGSIPSATGANAQGRGHPYSRSISRPGTPTAGNARPATQEKKYVLPEGRQTLLERVIHLVSLPPPSIPASSLSLTLMFVLENDRNWRITSAARSRSALTPIPNYPPHSAARSRFSLPLSPVLWASPGSPANTDSIPTVFGSHVESEEIERSLTSREGGWSGAT